MLTCRLVFRFHRSLSGTSRPTSVGPDGFDLHEESENACLKTDARGTSAKSAPTSSNTEHSTTELMETEYAL